MKLERFKTVFQTLTILALVVLVGSFVTSSVLTSGSVLAQRVEPSEVSSLFADDTPGTLIGSPQRIVIRDDKAFLEGTAADGARFVNEKYLRENNIYPLQVKTVEFFRNIVAFFAGLGAVLMGVLWWRSQSRVSRG
ncbi:MAG: hypothetical protein HC933_10430 [Pleurocapsa sp. SU_196_0]|nr:hypothetical protein [Pleurocapsa sp. SU_196_0]